jgi:hypothetical protein
MKNYFLREVILLLILFYIFFNFSSINSIEINKKDYKKNNNNNSKGNILLANFNFIAPSHYFPETGINNEYIGLLGIKYNNSIIQDEYLKSGSNSINFKNEMDIIAKNIYELTKRYNIDKDIKPYNILSISQRLIRSIKSSNHLNERLSILYNFTYNNNDNIKPFNLSLYNTTQLNKTESNKYLNQGNIINNFIPKNYDFMDFPIHFKIDKNFCNKIYKEFIDIINNNYYKISYRYYLKKIPNLDNFLNKKRLFRKINNIYFERNYNLSSYRNIIKQEIPDISLSYKINSILIEGLRNLINIGKYFNNNYNKKQNKNNRIKENNNINNTINIDFLDKEIKKDINKINIINDIFNKEKEINDIIKFDLFLVKNYSNEMISIYSSSIFKFLMNILYSKISTFQEEEKNDNLKDTIIVNLFLKDYQIAGFYKILSNLEYEVDYNEKVFDLNKLPNIKYGSILSMNFFKKIKNIDEKNIINNFYAEILFENNLVKRYGISELLNIINKYIINDPLFYINLCD